MLPSRDVYAKQVENTLHATSGAQEDALIERLEMESVVLECAFNACAVTYVMPAGAAHPSLDNCAFNEALHVGLEISFLNLSTICFPLLCSPVGTPSPTTTNPEPCTLNSVL